MCVYIYSFVYVRQPEREALRRASLLQPVQLRQAPSRSGYHHFPLGLLQLLYKLPLTSPSFLSLLVRQNDLIIAMLEIFY